MDFSRTEAQTAVGELSRKIFKDRVTPETLKEVEQTEDRFYSKLWADLANAGLLGTAVAEEYGGSGEGLLELCSLLRETGAAAAPIPLWTTLLVGAMPIGQFGSDAQKKRLLPGVVTGKTILSGALTEYDSIDPLAPAAVARQDGDAWLLTGVKTCVPAARLAARVLCAARTGADSVGVFLLDPKAPGVTLEPQIATTGEPQVQMTLDDARVDKDDVLGDPQRGAEILRWLVPRACVGLCVMELGITERVLKMTAAYTSERVQFDRPIATFQAVSQRAADCYVDVATIRLTTWQAAWRLSENLPADEAVSQAKYWAGVAGHRVVYAAQHLHGGIGYDLDYPLGRYYLLSKQIELNLGNSAQHLAKLGRNLAQ